MVAVIVDGPSFVGWGIAARCRRGLRIFDCSDKFGKSVLALRFDYPDAACGHFLKAGDFWQAMRSGNVFFKGNKAFYVGARDAFDYVWIAVFIAFKSGFQMNAVIADENFVAGFDGDLQKAYVIARNVFEHGLQHRASGIVIFYAPCGVQRR